MARHRSNASLRGNRGKTKERENDFSYIDLRGHDLREVPDELSKFDSLRTLVLSQNSLESLPEWLTGFSKLKELGISHNFLSHLPATFGQLRKLTTLNAYQNRLESLPTTIGELVNLTTLHISGNRLEILPPELGKLKKLQVLEATGNGLAHVPSTLANLVNLRILVLSNNRIQVLPDGIGNLKNLIELNLGENLILALPNNIVNLKRLKVLNLRNNQLQVLPHHLGSLKALVEFHCNGNMIHFLPTSIIRLSHLKIVSFHDNQIVEPPENVVEGGIKKIIKYMKSRTSKSPLTRERSSSWALPNKTDLDTRARSKSVCTEKRPNIELLNLKALEGDSAVSHSDPPSPSSPSSPSSTSSSRSSTSTETSPIHSPSSTFGFFQRRRSICQYPPSPDSPRQCSPRGSPRGSPRLLARRATSSAKDPCLNTNCKCKQYVLDINDIHCKSCGHMHESGNQDDVSPTPREISLLSTIPETFGEMIQDKNEQIRELEQKIAQLESGKRSLRSSKRLSTAASAEALLGQWSIDPSELKFLKHIGLGTFSTIYQGLYRGQFVAIKVLNNVTGKELHKLKKELDIHSQLRSPHVVYFFGSVFHPRVCVVMEYCSRGSLYHVMKDRENEFPWYRSIMTLMEVTQGVMAMHSWKPPIVHRDLKTNNILVDDRWGVKLADFGTARFLEERNSDTLKKLRGTYAYCPPEIYSGTAPFSTASDIFSLAIIFWEVVTRCITGSYHSPYEEYHPQFDFQIMVMMVAEQWRPTLPDTTPELLVKLIHQCWDQDLKARPSCAQVQDHLGEIQQVFVENSKKWNRLCKWTKKKKPRKYASTF